MMNNITYHKATLHDIQTLVDYRVLFMLELAGTQSDAIIQSLQSQMTAYFSKSIADNTCISFIATCDNKIAGIGSVVLREQPGNFKNPSGKWAYIMNMYTVPEYRRNGICKAILALLMEEGKKYGVTAFELHATAEGEKVYTQEGFVLHGEPTLRKIMG
jgi:predicted acetyltransferase